MKFEKNILFRLLFVAMIMFCLGLEVMNHTSYATPATEHSANQSNADFQSEYDQDLFEDDHLTANNEQIYFSDHPVILIMTPATERFHEFVDSGWQPPQHS